VGTLRIIDRLEEYQSVLSSKQLLLAWLMKIYHFIS